MLVRGVNFSGKYFAVATLILPLIFALFIITCSEKGNDPDPQTNLSNCKSFDSSASLAYETPPDQDCIEYSFVNGVLNINHVNAGFNCCADATIDVSIEADVITIEEVELLDGNGCRCLCLYDFDYSVANVQEKEYTIKILEPYLAEDDSEMEFSVNFTSEKSGTYCTTRDYYPWGEANSWSGVLKQHSACGGYDDTPAKSYAGDSTSCMIWEYSFEGTLSLRHTNTVLNCCPIIVAEINIENNIITITELDSLEGGGCDCLCIYDIDYEITNLWSGEYTIKVVEPYLVPIEDTLQTTINLSEEPSGSFCVDRKYLPFLM